MMAEEGKNVPAIAMSKVNRAMKVLKKINGIQEKILTIRATFKLVMIFMIDLKIKAIDIFCRILFVEGYKLNELHTE